MIRKVSKQAGGRGLRLSLVLRSLDGRRYDASRAHTWRDLPWRADLDELHKRLEVVVQQYFNDGQPPRLHIVKGG